MGQGMDLLLKRKENRCQEVLKKETEQIRCKVITGNLEAPVEQGEIVGKIEYYIEDKKWMEEELYCDRKIEKIDFFWCFGKIIEKII